MTVIQSFGVKIAPEMRQLITVLRNEWVNKKEINNNDTPTFHDETPQWKQHKLTDSFQNRLEGFTSILEKAFNKNHKTVQYNL